MPVKIFLYWSQKLEQAVAKSKQIYCIRSTTFSSLLNIDLVFGKT